MSLSAIRPQRRAHHRFHRFGPSSERLRCGHHGRGILDNEFTNDAYLIVDTLRERERVPRHANIEPEEQRHDRRYGKLRDVAARLERAHDRIPFRHVDAPIPIDVNIKEARIIAVSVGEGCLKIRSIADRSNDYQFQICHHGIAARRGSPLRYLLSGKLRLSTRSASSRRSVILSAS